MALTTLIGYWYFAYEYVKLLLRISLSLNQSYSENLFSWNIFRILEFYRYLLFCDAGKM